jgi:uncharacterized membrane protein
LSEQAAPIEVPKRVWFILYSIAFALIFGTTSGIAIGLFGFTLQTLKVVSILLIISIVSLLIAMPINGLLWNTLRGRLRRTGNADGQQ